MTESAMTEFAFCVWVYAIPAALTFMPHDPLLEGAFNPRVPVFLFGMYWRYQDRKNFCEFAGKDVGKDLIADDCRRFRIEAHRFHCRAAAERQRFHCRCNERHADLLRNRTNAVFPTIGKNAKRNIRFLHRLDPLDALRRDFRCPIAFERAIDIEQQRADSVLPQ